MGHFILGQSVGIAIGLVVGAFMPALGRKIKGLWVKETHSAKVAAGGAVAQAGKKLGA
jgi:hypothetical protein